MKQDNLQLRYDANNHPPEDELIDYLGGRITEVAHEHIQSHLTECDGCLELFKDVRDFFQARRGDDQIITEDITREWLTLWNRIEDYERAENVRVEQRWGTRTSRSMSLALAALLFIALGLGTWVMIQRRQKQQLTRQLEVAQQQTAQLQTQQQNLTEQAKQLEEDNLELRKQIHSAPARALPPVEITKPELNVPIYDLYARNVSRRSANDSEVNVISPPATANSIVLILNGEGLPPTSSYKIEILNDRGKAIWRGTGLRKDRLGNLTVTINRTLLPVGTYSLKLHGQDASSHAAAAEYVVRVQ